MTDAITPPRPLVTFALFAYNQEKYIREAVEGAFAQTYEPLEIILSDDCSSDRTYEIMQRIVAAYKGPHCVVLNRNPSNLNIGGHVNTVAALASGELIVMAAGDDISVPSRTQQLVQQWDALGRPPAVLTSDFEPIDVASKPVVLNAEAVCRGPFLIANMARGDIRGLGATAAITRSLISCFPPLQTTVRHEDRVFPFRALLLGGTVALVDKKLVQYRVVGGISRVPVKSGRDYVYRHIPALLARTLPDAIQRLSDLMAVLPGNVALQKACKAAIVDHQAWIDLTGARGFGIDVCLLKWLRKGAHRKALLKLYLKVRFVAFFDIYYRKRFCT